MTTANFDLVAAPYRWMEYASFGPFLQRCRTAQIHHLGSARKALLLGDGDGRFLARLLKSNPNLRVDVVDSSPAMLRLLERRIKGAGLATPTRIRLHNANALEWKPAGTYDLVVSHFFFDCFSPDELQRLFNRILPHLAADSNDGPCWLVSEFFIPSRQPASFFAKAVVYALYRAFGTLTGLPVRELPDHSRIMQQSGMFLNGETIFLGGLLRSQLWSTARGKGVSNQST